MLCYKCSGKDLHYNPICERPPISKHPYYIDPKEQSRRSKKGREANKVGRKVQSRIAQKLEATDNKSSWGWDCRLKELNLTLEVKSRGSDSKPWPTKEEWQTLLVEGIDMLVITEHSNDKGARVCMPLNTLIELLDAIERGENGRPT